MTMAISQVYEEKKNNNDLLGFFQCIWSSFLWSVNDHISGNLLVLMDWYTKKQTN
jgi:hypothetical protein